MVAAVSIRLGPPQGSKRGDTRTEILLQAERIFADVGFAGSSLDMIAEVVGIRRPSVLHHFRSKREIYDAVEKAITEELAARTEERTATGTAFDRILALLDTWLDFVAERPTAARIFQRNTADLVSRAPDPIQFSDRLLKIFEAIVVEGQAAGTIAQVDAMMALNILGGGILHYACNGEQLGARRRYRPAAASSVRTFQALLQATAKALLAPPQSDGSPP